MTMQAPLAAAEALLPGAARREVRVTADGHTLVVDDDAAGPTPLELLAGAVAAEAAMAARGQLERDGDRGDVEVVVSVDAGAPPLLYRRVLVPYGLLPADARDLAEHLGRTELAMMLAPAFDLRTQIEHDGTPLT